MKPFIQIMPVVGEIMVSYYPEVLQQKDFIEKWFDRGNSFHETINEGLSMLNEVIKEVKDAKGDTLDGNYLQTL